ncbi:MAG TPA: hypothetical protein VJU84_20795 [Pyrinomonadaceae bacterium]|nr:hypothetical protein [Pyrinomonadaceae bacterium]
MKTLKVICIELVLAVFLSGTAYAGDISTPGMTATPIPSPTREMSEVNGTTDPVSPTSGSLVPVDLIQLLAVLVF